MMVLYSKMNRFWTNTYSSCMYSVYHVNVMIVKYVKILHSVVNRWTNIQPFFSHCNVDQFISKIGFDLVFLFFYLLQTGWSLRYIPNVSTSVNIILIRGPSSKASCPFCFWTIHFLAPNSVKVILQAIPSLENSWNFQVWLSITPTTYKSKLVVLHPKVVLKLFHHIHHLNQMHHYGPALLS